MSTATAFEVSIDQEFQLLKDLSGTPIGGYGRATIAQGETVRVTKLTANGFWVRGPRRNGSSWESKEITIPFYGEFFEDFFEMGDPANRPRRLGEVPEGGISPDDPRLAWLWEDAGKFATRVNHCTEYDKICDALGIPGRIREFSITRTINDFKISKKIKARSKKEANEIFDLEIKTFA